MKMERTFSFGSASSSCGIGISMRNRLCRRDKSIPCRFRVRSMTARRAGRSAPRSTRANARALEPRAEAAALAHVACDVERRPVARQGMLRDREPEPGAPGLARTAAIDPIEALRQPRQVLGRDADARVLDVERRGLRGGVPAKLQP